MAKIIEQKNRPQAAAPAVSIQPPERVVFCLFDFKKGNSEGQRIELYPGDAADRIIIQALESPYSTLPADQLKGSNIDLISAMYKLEDVGLGLLGVSPSESIANVRGMAMGPLVDHSMRRKYYGPRTSSGKPLAGTTHGEILEKWFSKTGFSVNQYSKMSDTTTHFINGFFTNEYSNVGYGMLVRLCRPLGLSVQDLLNRVSPTKRKHFKSIVHASKTSSSGDDMARIKEMELEQSALMKVRSKEIGATVKAWMRHQQLTSRDMSEATGISVNMIEKMLAGSTFNTRPENIVSVARALNISPNDIYAKELPPKPSEKQARYRWLNVLPLNHATFSPYTGRKEESSQTVSLICTTNIGKLTLAFFESGIYSMGEKELARKVFGNDSEQSIKIIRDNIREIRKNFIGTRLKFDKYLYDKSEQAEKGKFLLKFEIRSEDS